MSWSTYPLKNGLEIVRLRRHRCRAYSSMSNSARAMMTMRKATHGFLTSRELRYKNNSRFDAKQVLIVETADSDDKDKWNSQVKQE